MYQPGYQPAHSSSDDGTDDAAIIDLVEMHRDHCPWRNPDTQRSAGTLNGLNACQILQRVVSTHAREQRRRAEQQQKAGQQPELDEADGLGGERSPPASPAPSKEEVARQDKERESRLKRLKSLFTVKRKSMPLAKPAK